MDRGRGDEDQQTRIVLSWVRRNWSMLADDLTLLFMAVRTMMRRGRWRGRVTGGGVLVEPRGETPLDSFRLPLYLRALVLA